MWKGGRECKDAERILAEQHTLLAAVLFNSSPILTAIAWADCLWLMLGELRTAAVSRLRESLTESLAVGMLAHHKTCAVATVHLNHRAAQHR